MMKFMGSPISTDVSFDLDFFGECHKERENRSATQYNLFGVPQCVRAWQY